MKAVIDPGRKRKSISMIDNIVYSRQKDLEGNPLELKMSVMLQNGNSEMKLATGQDDDWEDHAKKPALVWVPGGGWRGADKNLMVPEMSFLADAGYVVASIYYRSSAQGHYPDQIVDVKTAIRFLRAHADKYEIDPDRIGILGRSAGGHLSAMAAMNTSLYGSEEWGEYSADVSACCDMFGPVDLEGALEQELDNLANIKNYRWKRLEDSHLGALMGGDLESIRGRVKEASPIYHVNPAMCPILILHGDADPAVPWESSEKLYQAIVDAGMEERAEFYTLKGGGHGSREFFQPEVKAVMVEFFDRYLK